MAFKKVGKEDAEQLRTIVGEQFVLIDSESLMSCSSDETEDLEFLPEVVLRPGTVEEVSRIMKYCNEQKIPVTPRGAGNGAEWRRTRRNGWGGVGYEAFRQDNKYR